MQVTNKYNLPQAFVDLVANSQFGFKDKCFSATALVNPTQLTILTKQHFDDIVVDASERVNTVLGTATHSLLEKMDKTGMAEIYLKEPIKDGYFLTGKCDLYDEANTTLVDYKTATCWKIIYKDFKDWRTQGLIYAWLLTKRGNLVTKLKFHAILKDWTAREKRLADFKGDFYPDSAVWTWEYDVTTQDLIEIEQFIYNKFDELIAADNGGELPPCSNEDTWYTGDKFAVYVKESDKKAKRVFDTYSQAQEYVDSNGGFIVERKGEHRRCEDYCDVCKWCKQVKI